jgi:flagellar hook assembly protein FlgD
VPVRLTIYDALGRVVRVLVQEEKEPGVYTAAWDGRNGRGRAAASGVYFYELRAGDYAERRKMVMTR